MTLRAYENLNLKDIGLQVLSYSKLSKEIPSEYEHLNERSRSCVGSLLSKVQVRSHMRVIQFGAVNPCQVSSSIV